MMCVCVWGGGGGERLKTLELNVKLISLSYKVVIFYQIELIMPLIKLDKCCFCLRIHDNNYIDNIINLSVSLPLEESDFEKRGTGGKDWVI